MVAVACSLPEIYQSNYFACDFFKNYGEGELSAPNILRAECLLAGTEMEATE